MDIAQGIELVASAILFALPAYIANAAPLILARFVVNRKPMDLGRCWVDGRRILGDNKSIEGFASGVLAGLLVGTVLDDAARGFLMGLGAMIGDVLGSFVKRRLNIEEGASAPVLDQYLFMVVALLLSRAAGYIPSREQLLVILIATPILHVTSNYVAYLFKMKSKPL
ncbi:MAG: CDP-2,3-bis-(O-geranylgeranyl)-sn-glycerol synthase [Candidatus Nezhaarchaeota archaeon]|nr:CDP-2,3-bis-(O-geranylgeranyl)-sn-glycerol synthase [Candidatus Nezhaarchaeota archaeon]